jgi:hypothetical protein
MYIPVRRRICSRDDRVFIFDSSYTAVFAAGLPPVPVFLGSGLAALSSLAREARPLPVTVFPPDFDAPAAPVVVCVLFAILPMSLEEYLTAKSNKERK